MTQSSFFTPRGAIAVSGSERFLIKMNSILVGSSYISRLELHKPELHKPDRGLIFHIIIQLTAKTPFRLQRCSFVVHI